MQTVSSKLKTTRCGYCLLTELLRLRNNWQSKGDLSWFRTTQKCSKNLQNLSRDFTITKSECKVKSNSSQSLINSTQLISAITWQWSHVDQAISQQWPLCGTLSTWNVSGRSTCTTLRIYNLKTSLTTKRWWWSANQGRPKTWLTSCKSVTRRKTSRL